MQFVFSHFLFLTPRWGGREGGREGIILMCQQEMN